MDTGPAGQSTGERTREPMRERIIDVAIDLFARQGYQGTSLRHLAERLGISKAAVYHHYRAKDDIARVVIRRALDAIADMSDRLVVAGTDPAAWQRALGRRLQPKQATGNCSDGCSTCGACGPKPPAAAHDAQPLEFRPRAK